VTIGDPLLDPKLVERARYVRDHHPQLLPIGFNTTLQFLHKFNLDDIFDCGIGWITVSTTLSGRERYVEFFGVDKYEQMMTNLITLLTENRSRGYPIDVQLSIKATDEPPETVLAHPDFRRIQELTLQDLENEVHNRGYFVDDWIGAVELPPYLKKRPLVPRAFRPCGQLYNGLMLYSNGKVGACCCRDFEASSELILGHVRENTLAEMWNGDNLARLRSEWKWKNRVPEICKGCRHYIY
jgi:radical SAM protein with 4Fe4S-binding SPASM domain